MKNKLLVTMILASAWFYAGAQWQHLHPRPVGWNATSLSAPGESRLYAVAGASILVSENFGATWKTVNINDGAPYFYEISFGNPLQGVACSSGGKVYVTADGGQNWTMKQLTPSADFYSVMMLSSGVGFAGGDYGKLFKTTDFGENWTPVQETFDQDDIARIFILDENNIFLYDDWDAFYSTTDGGQTWSESSFTDINLAHSMHFFDANTGLVGDDYGNLLKTTNGGQTWEKIYDDGESAFYSMSFLNNTKGIVGSYDKFMITADGGENWTNIDMTGFTRIYAVKWVSESIIYASCEGGIIIRSMDGGLSWEKVTHGAAFTGSIKTIGWYDENTLLAFTVSPTEVIKSTNRGYSWETMAAPAEGFFRYNNSWAIPGEVLYVTTLEGAVYKTTDAGNTWQTIETGIAEQTGDIHFLNAETGFLSANNGTINRTVDGGETWATVSSGTPNITRITFHDTQLGLAVGAGGTILRTTDEGLSWTNITNTNTKAYFDVCFADQNIVFAVGESGRIFRSEDAGLTWGQIASGVNYNLISMEFLTPQLAYITTNLFGQSLKTIDGGETWELAPYLAPAQSRSIKTPDGSMMVFGDYAQISILPNEETWSVPSTPVALEASQIGESSFTANWQAVEGATAYYLMVSDDDFQTYLPGYVPKICQQTSTLVEGIEADKTYQYKVIAVSEKGYSDYSNIISVQTLQTDAPVLDNQGISLYPNPVINAFTIAMDDTNPTRMAYKIYDVAGRLIMASEIEDKQTHIDISNITPAIYFVAIVKENQDVKTYKIIKK
jgi:photosystem II stability/assembly factor-like uncharacterized protein